ncbi:hypothetical protein [Sphingomonas aracearum]|uniref:hypothetical protein n=1 Tax=Sphingomonas aracearum TaxID=2283317 RepID=UPI0011C022DE|nr:hypothetical protein [Sphingomonas aracearum]
MLADRPDAASSGATTELTMGVAAWEGDFGAPSRSDITAVLVNLRQRVGPVRIDATLPWMRVVSSSTIFTGIDGTPLVVAPAIPMGRRERKGVGDLTLGASWLALREAQAGLNIDVSARAKLPTAGDSTQLSTGKTDYAFGIEASRTMGAITPVVRAKYRIFGDPPGWRIRDGFATSLGAAAALFEETVMLISYDFAERTSRFIKPSHEIVAATSAPIGRHFRLTAYGSAGLSSGAAAFSGGTSLTLRF